MNEQETTTLLGYIAASDNRVVDAAVIAVWQDALRTFSAAEARAGVERFMHRSEAEAQQERWLTLDVLIRYIHRARRRSELMATRQRSIEAARELQGPRKVRESLRQRNPEAWAQHLARGAAEARVEQLTKEGVDQAEAIELARPVYDQMFSSTMFAMPK